MKCPAMAPHSSTLAWKIPWMEEPRRLNPWDRWGSDRTERLHFPFSLSCIGEGNGNPLQYSCLENPRDGGAWWAAIYGVAQSQTQLKRLSNSSSIRINSMLSYSEYSWTIATCNKLNEFFKRNVEPKKRLKYTLSVSPSIENPENSPQNEILLFEDASLGNKAIRQSKKVITMKFRIEVNSNRQSKWLWWREL